jgi:hypothetical protein
MHLSLTRRLRGQNLSNICERGGVASRFLFGRLQPQETAATIASLSTSLKPETDRRRGLGTMCLCRSRFQAFGLCRLQTLQPEENLDLGLARTVTLRQ